MMADSTLKCNEPAGKPGATSTAAPDRDHQSSRPRASRVGQLIRAASHTCHLLGVSEKASTPAATSGGRVSNHHPELSPANFNALYLYDERAPGNPRRNQLFSDRTNRSTRTGWVDRNQHRGPDPLAPPGFASYCLHTLPATVYAGVIPTLPPIALNGSTQLNDHRQSRWLIG
jgi:hypothetical protein